MARAHQNQPPSNNTMNPRAEPPSPLGDGGAPPPIAGAPMPPVHALGAKMGDTYVQTISTAPVELFSPEQLQGADGQIRPSMARRDYNPGVPREPEPEIERWVVLQQPEAPVGGATFRRGKILDSLNYPIDRLIAMGIIMQRIPKGRTAADVLAGRVPAELPVTATAATA